MPTLRCSTVKSKILKQPSYKCFDEWLWTCLKQNKQKRIKRSGKEEATGNFRTENVAIKITPWVGSTQKGENRGKQQQQQKTKQLTRR